MATRKFCDACDKEITDQTATHIGIEVYVQKKGQRAPFYAERGSRDAPLFDICKYCIIDAFKKLDDRAMEMPKYGVPREPFGTMQLVGGAAMMTYEPGVNLYETVKHVWRTMFDEAVRMLPPAYGKGGATREPLDDRLRVPLEPPQ